MRRIHRGLASAAGLGQMLSTAACLDFSAETEEETSAPDAGASQEPEGADAQEEETSEESADEEADSPEDPVALSIEVEELEPAAEGEIGYAYTITVTNYSADLDSARLVHMVPAGLETRETEPEPDELSELEAVWEISLPAGDYLEVSREVGADSAEDFAEDSASGQLLEIEGSETEDEFSSTVCIYEEPGAEALACETAYSPQP